MLWEDEWRRCIWRCMKRQTAKDICSWRGTCWRRCSMPKGTPLRDCSCGQPTLGMDTPEGLWPVQEPMLRHGQWDAWRSGRNPVRNMEQQKETIVHLIQAYCVASCFTKGIGTDQVQPTAKTRGVEDKDRGGQVFG